MIQTLPLNAKNVTMAKANIMAILPPLRDPLAVERRVIVLDIFSAQAEKSILECLPIKAHATDFGTTHNDTLKGFRVKAEDKPAKKGKSKKKVVNNKELVY